MRVTNIMLIGLIIIATVIFIKYKPLYRVTINGETVGYVKNKNNFENRIVRYINTQEETCIAFKTLEVEQNYELEFVNKNQTTNEDEIFEIIKQNTETIYTMYAILVNDDITSYVETEQEAQKTVDELNEKYKEQAIPISIRQIYSTTKQEIIESDVAIAKVSTEKIDPIITSRAEAKAREISKIVATQSTTYVEKESNANGVTFSVQPISGVITSKFGSRGAGRSTVHTGLDISAPTGTSIRAATGGTVIYAQYAGSYGNILKIMHENGVETWYAHCSELYVGVGSQVSAGDIIASVGSTGNSTGPHLHLEIRINGSAVNPQIYMY